MASKQTTTIVATTKFGVGYFILALIAQGKTNDQIMSAVEKKFPAAKTNKGCISWYRCNQKLV